VCVNINKCRCAGGIARLLDVCRYNWLATLQAGRRWCRCGVVMKRDVPVLQSLSESATAGPLAWLGMFCETLYRVLKNVCTSSLGWLKVFQLALQDWEKFQIHRPKESYSRYIQICLTASKIFSAQRTTDSSSMPAYSRYRRL
jgi:hypothetical protein